VIRANIVFFLFPALFLHAGAAIGDPSLKNKTDEELFQMVSGGRNDQLKKNDEEASERYDTSVLDGIWELPPQQAALTIASHYVEKAVRGNAEFAVDNPNLKPPSTGEIGMRWVSGNYWRQPERGVVVLHNDGARSRISLSDFQILGPPSYEEYQSALHDVDDHKIPPLVARQTYEILWWLQRTRHLGDSMNRFGFASTDDWAETFWMRPDGPFFAFVIFGSNPDAEGLQDKDFSTFPAFAYMLLGYVMRHQGIKPRQPLPTIGQPNDPHPEARFFRLYPQPESDDPATVKKWVAEMTAILRRPDRYKMYSDVISALVPNAYPRKYTDPKIDRALLDLLHDGEKLASGHRVKRDEAKQKEKEMLDQISNGNEPDEDTQHALSETAIKEQSAVWSIRSAAEEAGEMLGLRDNVSSFPKLLDHAKNPPVPDKDDIADSWPSESLCLTGASELAGKHPELRSQLAPYIHAQLEAFLRKTSRPDHLFDCVWRADLRNLAPDVEKLATSSPEENEDPSTALHPAPPGSGKFHAARVLLLAWREPDALTKMKLDALFNVSIAYNASAPGLLRTEFDKLSPADKAAFRKFVMWLRTNHPSSSIRSLEDAFAPHTPRPDDEPGMPPDYR
jgi:hypothetical protein